MNSEDQIGARGVSSPTRWAIFILLSLLALAVRLPQLGVRPMHTDESVNAYITGQLLAGESFHYDPRDRHGPALFAMAEPLAKLLGARGFADLTEWQLRLGPVLVGSATVLMFGAGVEMFGFVPCLVAAILFAFAPLPVYYNRYFIHETLFVAATFGLILTGWRAWQKNSVWAAGLAGGCAALMLACKETAVLHLFALGVAAACAWFLAPREKAPTPRGVAVALATLLVVAVTLFTWFGQNLGVFADLLNAVPHLVARAGGEGHAKPFDYYLHLMDPTLVLYLVALGGAYGAICDAVNSIRKPQLLLVIYGLLIVVTYSAIPYKTPWLALNLWLPLALGCGLGVAAFCEQIHNASGRWLVGIAGVLLLAVLCVQTKVLAFHRPADERNPYAYAHTSEDLLGLPPRLAQLAAENHLAQPRIAVVAADAWPLPWYLRKFANVGYWQAGQETGSADFWITTGDLPDLLKARQAEYRGEFFQVRPGVLVTLWIPPGFKFAP